MGFRAVRSILLGLCLGAVSASGVGVMAFPGRLPAAQSGLARSEPSLGTLPVVAEHRYRVAAKIRPLLLFWIGKDNVGGARIRWRRGEGEATGYDVLIGSDPARAPRGVNRWGFILEEGRPGAATVVGLMKQSDEQSLEEAKTRVATEAKGGVVFKMIQAAIGPTESVAKVTIATVPKDYSYRELGALVEALSRETSPPRVRRTAVPPGGRVGFISGIVELLRDGVEGVRQAGKAPGAKRLAYAYYEKQYDLTRTSSIVETNATYGGKAYSRLLKSEFELRARREGWVERFTVVCGVDREMAAIPVFLTYQPRWWFRVELVLDEREVF